MKALVRTEERRPKTTVLRAVSAEPALCAPAKTKHDGTSRDVMCSFSRACSAGEVIEQEHSTRRDGVRPLSKFRQKKTKPMTEDELEALLEDDAEAAEQLETVVSF
jgi:hypothetical protein